MVRTGLGFAQPYPHGGGKAEALSTKTNKSNGFQSELAMAVEKLNAHERDLTSMIQVWSALGNRR